ncbi:MAG: DUF192 domain-containing protein, partial [Candidatus Ryanbacteria bacterium]|nr:DUF192 domain-containing protein [Candidatus Ryanbacteria bacterium]
MTRWLTRSVVLALVILGFFFFSNNFADAPRSAVTIGGSRVEVEIANTAEERARGLMHRASLPEESGMLFLFSEASTQSFWNQNTLIPL